MYKKKQSLPFNDCILTESMTPYPALKFRLWTPESIF